MQRVVPKHINLPLPTEGTFILYRPSPWNFHFRGCLSYSSLHGLVPPGKNIAVKNTVALSYFYAKDNCFCDKERNNLLIYVNTVSNNLNFA